MGWGWEVETDDAGSGARERGSDHSRGYCLREGSRVSWQRGPELRDSPKA